MTTKTSQPAGGALLISEMKEFAGFPKSTQRYIRRGTHRSTRQLEDAIKNYVKVNNVDPKPCIWSKNADDILASIERFCLQTSDSRH